MAGKFETLLDQANAWLHALQGENAGDGWKVACELAGGIADLLGESQPCGFPEPHLAVCTRDGTQPVAGIVAPEAVLDPSEARAYAAMLLRAADEAEAG